jgi:hypothetical protein
MKRSVLFHSRLSRLTRLLLAAAAFCLLAGCSGAAASPSSSRAEASLAPSQVSSSSNTLPAPSVDAAENGLTVAQSSLASPGETLDGLLTWGPGTAGCTLHSVICATKVLDWATQNQLAAHSEMDIAEALAAWYDELDAYDQETLAETWPMVRDDANALLADHASMADLLETAGLEADAAADANADDFAALCEAADALFIL